MKNKEKLLQTFNAMCKNTLMETLDIEYIDVGEDFLVAKMPVSPKVHQPDGVLNGGATLALAESVGSPMSMLAVDHEKYTVRGMQMSANHVGSVRDGYVLATATFVHKGRSTHVIEIDVKSDSGKPVSVCRLTNMIIERR